jgi:hypothetical protein
VSRRNNRTRAVRGIGLDAARITRFERLIGRPAGDAFGRLAYTEAERERIGADPSLWAVIFTAKEATAKALGVGIFDDDGGVACGSLEIEPTDVPFMFRVRARRRPSAVDITVSHVVVGSALARGHAISIAWALDPHCDVEWAAAGLRSHLNDSVPIALGGGVRGDADGPR